MQIRHSPFLSPYLGPFFPKPINRSHLGWISHADHIRPQPDQRAIRAMQADMRFVRAVAPHPQQAWDVGDAGQKGAWDMRETDVRAEEGEKQQDRGQEEDGRVGEERGEEKGGFGCGY